MKNFFLLSAFLILASISFAQNHGMHHRHRTKFHWSVGGQVGNFPGNVYRNYPTQGNCNTTVVIPVNPGNGMHCGTQSYGYMNPLSDHEFGYFMETLSSQSFDDGKLGMANQMLSTHYVYSWQVKEIMNALSFDSTRLKFAKRAYSYTLDQNNYYMVNSAFVFSSSARELSESICRY